MADLGRVPVAGDEVRAGDVVLRVEAMEGRRVERLRVRLESPDGDLDDVTAQGPGSERPGTTRWPAPERPPGARPRSGEQGSEPAGGAR